MNNAAILTEHPLTRAADAAHAREANAAIQLQARKVARMFAEYEEERKKLERMYLAQTNLRGW